MKNSDLMKSLQHCTVQFKITMIIKAEIQTGKKEFKILEFNEKKGTMKIQVKSAPIKGKANKEITTNLKKILKSKVTITKGLNSTTKTLLIE